MDNQHISSISDYLVKLDLIMSTPTVYVFRGEVQNFSNFCIPNLFRDSHFQSSLFYEKNVLDKLRNDLVDDVKNSYLLTAIEAQHGGFPSRLLDVTFNSLIALHFAVTPHPHSKKEDVEKAEDSDGAVYVIEVSNLISPLSKNLTITYEEMINHNKKYYNPLYSNYYCFIDHYKKNRRISVQQGAFIMFFGNGFRPIHSKIINKIIIKKEAKAKIREDLERFFYISNSFVYPEPEYAIMNVLKHSILNNEFSNDNKEAIKTIQSNILEQARYLYHESIYNLSKSTETDETMKKMLFNEGFMKVESYLNECLNDIRLTLTNIGDCNHEEIESNIRNELNDLEQKIILRHNSLFNDGGNNNAD